MYEITLKNNWPNNFIATIDEANVMVISSHTK